MKSRTVLLVTGLIVAIIISLPFLVSAQPKDSFTKEYQLIRYCEVYENKVDSCFDVRGKVTVTNTALTFYIPNHQITFVVETSFKFRSHIYYHLVQPWYKGFFILEEGSRDINGDIHSSGVLDVSIIGQGVYTARLTLKQ